ncbi:GDSL-type esterase/lipase family protein [Rhodocytophaga aerolata]|uniref:GDSL-type esterase/lipase family protein n=1 Tax=Rhodocytophaga aerolata TaxID=455078 RepID=A0ABT8R5I8_9BACT|nr:SGNH/GDSL hydrolase family protein [Rhodocytophaga aerolata]MDO1446543.1 GDSL-type esterase/lipase family protein [Rhodocytophaga aerolata]
MLTKLSCVAVLFCFVWINGFTQSTSVRPANQVKATQLKPFGRYIFNASQELELISSAAQVGFRFEGRECKLYVTTPSGHNYLQYELDGVYQKRIRIDSQGKEPIVITASSSGKHTIWLYKATEAHTGPVIIRQVEADNIQPVERPAAPLIEFIGNSITCGAAADPSEVPCGTGQYHDQHNAYKAYGPRLARMLGVNYMLSSVSGIGVYRNWNSDGPAMPQVYEKTDFQANNPQQWDFKTYSPNIVSIALGTNDFSKGDGKKARLPFDSTQFIGEYIKFISLVKTKYPNVQIALLSSAMLTGKTREMLQNCLLSIKASIDRQYPQDKPVALFFFEPMQARGCTGHPNVEDHAILAKQLLPFFEKLIR